MRYVPVPYEALDAVDLRLWHCVTDLYRRAHALKWRAFTVTVRSLQTSWGTHNRNVTAVLDALESFGFLQWERGSKHLPSRIKVNCPTMEHAAHHEARHNYVGTSDDTDRSASQGASQGASTLTRGETERRDRDLPPTPRKRGALHTEWVAEIFRLEIETCSDPAGAAGRAERADRQLVDAVVAAVKGKTLEARGRWSGAPEGLRRKEIADGLRLAADRWIAAAAPELRYPLRQVGGRDDA